MIRRAEPPPTPWLVCKAEAARLLGLSGRMIDKLVERGELSRVRLGDRAGVRFDTTELRAFVESRRERAGAGGDGQDRDRLGRFRAGG
jgi:excisionase family DNA binding protein